MPRFIHHAHGLAVSGHITRPVEHYIEPVAVCVMPSHGGAVRCATKQPFSLTLGGEFILSFDSAETTIEGTEATPGAHSTVVTSTIRNLNVGNVLKADELVCKITTQYDRSTNVFSIGTEGSAFRNLTIGGSPWDVTIDHALGRECSADYAGFKRRHPDHKEGHGRIVHSLARHPKLKWDQPEDLGYHHEPGFGRIYFCEWKAGPYTQGLTMMRLQLGSPVAGVIALDDNGGNGSSFPPPPDVGP